MQRHSRQLERLVATDGRFNRYDFEGVDGHWVYTVPGYWNCSLETHCIHEWTVADALEELINVEACYCDDCARVNDARFFVWAFVVTVNEN